MCEAVGHPVVRLVRTRIGPLTDRTLRPGAWRHLTLEEILVALLKEKGTGERSAPRDKSVAETGHV